MVDATQLFCTVFVPGRRRAASKRAVSSIAGQHLKEQQIAGTVVASLAFEALGELRERQVLATAPGKVPPLDERLALACAATGVNDEPLR